VLGYGVLHAGVTRGERGYLWRERGDGGEVAAAAVDVIDTTGAGDAFHGVFTAMLAEGRPTPECARIATWAAAQKCARLGGRAGLPDREQLEAFLAGTPRN
jgi:sulfofructose kinase